MASSPTGQSTYAPMDIASAMHTMTLNPPDPSWYMDTGATSHMTSSNSNFSSYFNLSNNSSGTIVGNGHSIPVHGYGHTCLPSSNLPLSLNNVLHAPKIIKNVISVRKFTTENSVSVEFDPFGFFEKDFQMGMPIMRCNSRGDLYPLTSSINTQACSSALAAIYPSLWHDLVCRFFARD
ncbi:uncharacterized protein LOC110727382 [Chenopodium quinoa]|uniref:uncharacterized protein LOC110727382 n=1 Tax=Chenopodium quinoa TaxID=63459 RepID=UPI000B780847|nr:uncharacterized protein LOC110727382 [Chenopodium quinoa]